MIRKYLYAGAVLLIIAVVVFYSVSNYITSGTPTGITNVTVPMHGISGTPIAVNSSGISIIFVFAGNNTNIYFLNQSIYTGLSTYLSGNSMRSAYSYVAALNLNKTDVSVNNATALKEVYQTAATSNAPGSYHIYAVIDSTQGSPSYNSVVRATVVYKSYSYGNWVTHSGEALVAVVALIAGLALLIYGAIKKPKDEVEVAPVSQPPAAEKRKRGNR